MYTKLRSYLMLGLAISAVSFSSSSLAATVPLKRLGLTLNGEGLAYDTATKKAYFSLGPGFATAKVFKPIAKFTGLAGYSIQCGGVKVLTGQACSFSSVKYGNTTNQIKLFKGSAVAETYTVVFTNLPVIDLTSGTIIEDPKVNGTFRLMSGASATKDTGVLTMGIEYRGQTSSAYKKRSYGIGIGTAKLPKKVPLLDLPAGDDWILDASYADATFARNNLQMDIFNEIRPNKDASRPKGSNAIRGRLTEVVLNSKYVGVYILDQHVGPTLLGLKQVPTSKIYKADFAVWKKDLFFAYNPKDIAFNFSQSYPKTKADYTPLKSLIDFVVGKPALAFLDIDTKIDLNYLADWFLLARAFQGSDVSSKNFFLVQNAGSKFFIVPWDMGSAFGLFWDGSPEPAHTYIPTPDNNLINRLTADPDTGFNDILRARWNVLKNTVFKKSNVLARFSNVNAQLVRGGALSRERARWVPTTHSRTIIKAGKPVKELFKVPNYTAATPAYISKFMDTRLPAMDFYINNVLP